MKQRVQIINTGLIPFSEAWDLQDQMHKTLVDYKLLKREQPTLKDPTHFLFFCEHPHVYTLGKSGKENHLLVSEDFLRSKGADFIKINRGGDITYHGPGQLVAYPILDLDYFFNDIHHYMRCLEEVVIQSLSEFGIVAGRIDGWTGVWVDPEDKNKAKKICAFGVRTSRWVTMHGLALNVNTDLNFFNYIVPCGLSNTQVTSMKDLLSKQIGLKEVQHVMKEKFANVFSCQIHEPDIAQKKVFHET